MRERERTDHWLSQFDMGKMKMGILYLLETRRVLRFEGRAGRGYKEKKGSKGEATWFLGWGGVHC